MFDPYSHVETAEGTIGLFEPITPYEPETLLVTLIPITELLQRRYSADPEKSNDKEICLINPRENVQLIYRSPTDFEVGVQRQHCFYGHRREI